MRRREGLGSSIIFDALAANEIDAYVEYTGTIWANLMKRTDIQPREQTLKEVSEWLKRERGVTLVAALGFENAYALAMKKSEAERLGIRSIADLARHSPDHDDCRRLRISQPAGMGGDPQGLWPELQGRAGDAAGIHVSGRRPRGRCDLGLYQRRPHRAVRSRGAGRSEGRGPAL